MNIDELYTKEHHEKGQEMQVYSEHGKPLDMYITLAGMDSKAFKKSETELHRAILANKDADQDEVRAEAQAKVTIGWRGFMDGKKELEFSKKKAEQLYYNAPYIMSQVDEFISNRANFTKA